VDVRASVLDVDVAVGGPVATMAVGVVNLNVAAAAAWAYAEAPVTPEAAGAAIAAGAAAVNVDDVVTGMSGAAAALRAGPVAPPA
jgi:hypothetical protein